MQVILIVSTLTGALVTPTQMENAWLIGQGNLSFHCLLYNPKDAPSFFSGCWKTGTNPNLAFVNENLNISKLDRRTRQTSPRSFLGPNIGATTVDQTIVNQTTVDQTTVDGNNI